MLKVTTAPLTKFAPMIDKFCADDPCPRLAGFTEVKVGAAFTKNAAGPEVTVPPSGLVTVTEWLPIAPTVRVVIGTVKVVALTNTTAPAVMPVEGLNVTVAPETKFVPVSVRLPTKLVAFGEVMDVKVGAAFTTKAAAPEVTVPPSVFVTVTV